MCYLLVLLFRWPISCHHLLLTSNNQRKHSIFNIYITAENYLLLNKIVMKHLLFLIILFCVKAGATALQSQNSSVRIVHWSRSFRNS